MPPNHKRFLIFVTLLLLTVIQVSAQSTQVFPINEVGQITDTDRFDRFDFTVTELGTLNVKMTPTGDQTLDSLVYLLDDNGVIIAENDDIEGLGREEGSELSIPLIPGDYSIIATRFPARRNPSTGEYRIDIDLLQTTEDANLDMSDEVLAELGYPITEPNTTANWTVFAYYGADTNLEEDIIQDTNEFELGGGSDEDVRILVLIDRHPGYSEVDGDWAGTRLYEIAPNNDRPTVAEAIINTEPLVEFADEVDMGDPESLAAFLVWGIRTYPADNYVVSFGSHGAGWAGIIVDETNDNDTLSMTELRQVFETVKAETGVATYDLLINDACLMASIEYYDIMQDYFDLSIGSAELVTNPALDMTVLTETLRADSVTVSELGRQLVDIYINRDTAGTGSAQYFTYAVTDLNRFPDVVQALSAFAEVVNSNPQRHVPALTRARANSYTYNRLFGETEQIDLGDFMTQVIQFSSDFEQLVPAAENVIEALLGANVYGNAGEFAVTRTSYYNIFFPLDSDRLLDYYPESNLAEWEQMLINYFAYSRFEIWSDSEGDVSFHVPQEPQINITRTIPVDRQINFNLPIDIGVEVVATNVARGVFYVEKVINSNTALRLLTNPLLQDVPVPNSLEPLQNQNVWRSGVDQRDVTWNAGAFQIIDGQGEANTELLQKSFDSSAAYFLEGRYRNNPDDEWIAVKITFTPDPQREFDLKSSTFISVNASAGTFGVFEPQIGGQVQVARTEVDISSGRVTLDSQGNIYTISEDGLGANLTPVETGEYLLRFEVESFGQAPQNTDITVQVNNESIEANFRGQNFIEDLGFTAGVPVWWASDFAEDAAFLETGTINRFVREGNPYDSNLFLDVYIYQGVDDIDDARARYVSAHDAPERGVVNFNEFFTLDGQEVAEFQYQTTERFVRGLAWYDESRNTSLVFGVDDRDRNSTIANQLFDDFKDTLRFYEAVEIETTASWRYEDLSIEQSVAIPATWEQVTTDDGWVTYQSPTDTNVFAAFTTIPSLDADLLTIASDTVGINFSRNDIRTYVGEQHIWNSVQYTIDRDGSPYIGRIYATTANDANTSTYFIRVEAPENDAGELYNEILHPIVSSVLIENLYYVYDWRESIGLRFEVPNPTFAAAPYFPTGQSTATGVTIAEFDGVLSDRRFEIYFAPGFNITDATTWFATYWEIRQDPYQFSNSNFIEVNGLRAFEFNLDVEIAGQEWSGKYFAVRSEPDDMLYIIGGRSLDGVSIDTAYNHLRDTIEFNFGNFDLYTSLTNRDLYDPRYAIDFDVFRAMQPLRITRNNDELVDFIRTFDDQYGILLYVINEASDDLIAEFGRIGRLQGAEILSAVETTVDGRPAVDITLGFERYIVVYDEERNRVVAAGVFNTTGDGLEIFERIVDTFTIQPLE